MTSGLRNHSGSRPAAGTPAPAGAGTEGELWTRFARIERRVRSAVAARRAVDPEPDDPYRGQYLTPEAAQRTARSPRDALAATLETVEPALPPPGSALGRLAEAFGLAPLDIELLLVAMAPDLDARFEPLYGYLNDDLTRRRPTVGLALELCGLPTAGPGRFRLSPAAPLAGRGVLELTETDRPLLSRVLRVPDRVTAYLLGDDEIDHRLRGIVRVGRADGAADPELVRRVRDVLTTSSPLVYLRATDGEAAPPALDALASAGLRPLVLDLAALLAAPVPAHLPHLAAFEARLGGSGIVAGPVDLLELRRPERARLLYDLCEAAAGTPLILYGRTGWDPRWAQESPVPFAVAPPGRPSRLQRWERALAAAGGTSGVSVPGATAPPRGGLAEEVASWQLGAEQIRKAASLAVRSAAAERRPVSERDVRLAARAQNGAGLEQLARRVEPAVGWSDLVLPDATRAQLRELALRARHRDQVLGEWRMRPGGGRGRGVIALFAGESGTGKTMSAEVVAGALGMDLYVVDLSTVVDKYIGETEKNLERIFAQASEVNGVLLFDEADAIFGKRSQVKDAHDRHANVESAYLLQRMESFDGIAVLTTNLRANLDEAFTRRLDVVAEFPMPDRDQRLALWDQCLGARIPRDGGLDLDFCAERFELAGGSIRACAVTAAYLAAESAQPLGTAQVVSAVLQEYRKLGRLVLESEFGPWLDGARESGPSAAG
ncbi:ATP-binding protein [Streptomyces qinglanensis]|uniref:ATP-binding protein n=1 Tax=Streptomyces qinglanensis TaxID=943816 RepID=UPI003D733955